MSASIWSDPEVVSGSASAEDEVPRDRWGRPLIKQADGSTQPYTRTSRIAKVTDDIGGLINWSSTQTLKGLIARPDLFEIARTHREDESALKKRAAEAKEAAASSASANIGTALHWWTEQADLGQLAIAGAVPEDYEAMLDVYADAMRPFEVLDTEVFVVNDELGVAGTLDRLLRLPDGRVAVGDLKTGKHAATYGAQSVAIQTAVYARSQRYFPETGEREPLHIDLDPDVTVLIHLPYNEDYSVKPTCDIVYLDGRLGWYGAQLADAVLKWRKTSVILSP